MMYKNVFIAADFANKRNLAKVKVETGETKKNLFGKDKPVTKKINKYVDTNKKSDSLIDGASLANNMNLKMKELSEEGYEIISITPVESGSYNANHKMGSISSSKRIFSETEAVSGSTGYGYGYGYSYTEGIIITALKRN